MWIVTIKLKIIFPFGHSPTYQSPVNVRILIESNVCQINGFRLLFRAMKNVNKNHFRE